MRKWKDSTTHRFLPLLFRLISLNFALFTSALPSSSDDLSSSDISDTDYTFNLDIIEALMIESLRNNLVEACDGERIVLNCPKNTHIVVGNSFYGRLVPSDELCPSVPKESAQGDANSTDEIEPYEDTSCAFPRAHSRVVDLCRKKRRCRLHVTPEFFMSTPSVAAATSDDDVEEDPCPTTSKYLQVSYKCKPDGSFCEGTHMHLNCKPDRRLSIYSAHYGRTINGQGRHCSLLLEGDEEDEGNEKNCVGDVLPIILQKCHAQSECKIAVNDQTFGDPCEAVDEESGRRGSLKYLSIIYRCVNDEVFNEAAIRGTLESMVDLEEELDRLRRLHRPVRVNSLKASVEYGQPATTPPSDAKMIEFHDMPEKGQYYEDRRTRVEEEGQRSSPGQQQVEDIDDLVHYVTALNLPDNKEKSLLYFFLSTSAVIILLLLACIYYQCRARRQEKKLRNHQTVCLPSSSPLNRSPIEIGSLLGSQENTSPENFDDKHEYCGVFRENFRRPDHCHARSGGQLYNGMTATSGWSSGSGGSGNAGGSGHYIRFAQPLHRQSQRYITQHVHTPRQITPVRIPSNLRCYNA